MMSKSQGLTLLEMLLVLAIGATIITMAVRYFSVTERNLHVTQSIQQIQTLTQASYTWLQAQHQENFSDIGPNGGTRISMQALIDAGLVEDTDTATNDVWGKRIKITPGTQPQYVSIKLRNIPKAACKNLARRLEAISKIPPPPCNGKRSIYKGEF